MARPRMSAAGTLASYSIEKDVTMLTMDITLSLIRLSNKQVGDVASDVVLVTDSIASEDFL